MQGGLKHWTRILLTSAALVVAAGQVSAETLVEAMVSAYSSNPTLQAERARQRGTDELVPQALSGWRPTVNTEGSIANVWSDASGAPATENDPKSVAIGLSQPVFRGFKTIMGTKAAEANVEAGKQSLLAIEQDILFQAIQADFLSDMHSHLRSIGVRVPIGAVGSLDQPPDHAVICLLYTSPSPRDRTRTRMPSSA